MDIIPFSLRISQIIVDVDKDMAGHVLKNLGAPVDPKDAARVDMAGKVLKNLGPGANPGESVRFDEFNTLSSNFNTHRTATPLDHPDGSVTTAKIKSAIGGGSGSIPGTSSVVVTLNPWSFWPEARTTETVYPPRWEWPTLQSGTADGDHAYVRFHNDDTSAKSYTCCWRYITSSRNPWIAYIKHDQGELFWVSEPVDVDPIVVIYDDGRILKPEIHELDDYIEIKSKKMIDAIIDSWKRGKLRTHKV